MHRSLPMMRVRGVGALRSLRPMPTCQGFGVLKDLAAHADLPGLWCPQGLAPHADLPGLNAFKDLAPHADQLLPQVEILVAIHDVYAAAVDDALLVHLGPGAFEPGAGWAHAEGGRQWKVWQRKS